MDFIIQYRKKLKYVATSYKFEEKAPHTDFLKILLKVYPENALHENVNRRTVEIP